MKFNRLILSYTLLAACFGLQAADMPLKVGVRAGVNTSNISETRTAPGMTMDHNKLWKPGLTIGAIVDISMGKNFYLSPGFFYDYRHDTYTVTSTSYPLIEENSDAIVITNGSVTTNWFHLPMLVSYRIPIAFMEFQFDLGPYFSMGLGGRDKYQTSVFKDEQFGESIDIIENAFGKKGRYLNLDWGLDMGVGMLFANHYYIGAHYLLGVRNLAQDRMAVKAAYVREWQLTVGYNF